MYYFPHTRHCHACEDARTQIHITKKPILMACNRPHQTPPGPPPPMSYLPAGCFPWQNTLPFLPSSWCHLIYHSCWHERESCFALIFFPHQESMSFILCLILEDVVWLAEWQTGPFITDHGLPACPLSERAQKPKLHFQADCGLQVCLWQFQGRLWVWFLGSWGEGGVGSEAFA